MALAVLAFELRNRGQNYAAVQPQEAIRLMNQGAQVVDLRDTAAFAAGHVTGARNLAPRTARQRRRVAEEIQGQACWCCIARRGSAAASLTRQLHAAGFTKVFTLRGGLAAWRAEGLPLQRG